MNSLDATIRNNKTKGELSIIRKEGNVPAIVYVDSFLSLKTESPERYVATDFAWDGFTNFYEKAQEMGVQDFVDYSIKGEKRPAPESDNGARHQSICNRVWGIQKAVSWGIRPGTRQEQS